MFLVLGSFAATWIGLALNPKEAASVTLSPLEQRVRQDWQKLGDTGTVEPRELSQWLRLLLPNLKNLAEDLSLPVPTLRDYEKSGVLLTYTVRPLITRHAKESESRKPLEEYITAYLGDKTPEAERAIKSLKEQASQVKPVALANELYASLLLREKDQEAALVAFMSEGTHFKEAKQAREKASQLAIQLKDKDTLRAIIAAGWLADLPAIMEHRIGAQLRDLGMEWRGLFRHFISTLRYDHLGMTLLAASLWYFILVQHIPANHWRWVYPVLPLIAGVASVWPTISLVIWQEQFMGITSDASFPYDLWYLIIGVGMREEVCKLALAALFMPWLVWKRLPGIALMTGAFVGLGFALEENLEYYARHNNGTALVRFLTANFMHVAMTGLTTHALYDMLRSRFHRTQDFLLTFLSIVVAHAVYDYDFDLPGLQGLSSYIPYIILGFLAWRFWDQVEMEMPHSRQLIAPAAVFLLGTAIMISGSFLLATDFDALYETATVCVSFLFVALIYWRRFENSLVRH